MESPSVPRRFDAARWLPPLLALPVLAASALFTPETLPAATVCGLRRVTGIPCPGCGMTRAFCCIGHGELARAWAYNPFAFVLYAAVVLALAWPLIAHLAPRFAGRAVSTRWILIAWLALAVAMAVFGVVRALEFLELV